MADASIADLYDLATQVAPPPADNADLYALHSTAVKAAPANTTNVVDDFFHKVTGGLGDKAEAALEASGLASNGVPGNSFSDRYHKDLTNTRNNYTDFEAANPGQAKGATVASVAAPLLLGPESDAGAAAGATPGAAATVAKAAPTFRSAALKSGATGAGVGGAYGFGQTDDSSLEGDLEGTAIGAAAGGLTGLAAPTMAGIATSPFKLAARGVNAFTKGGQDLAAGRVLNGAADLGNPGATTFETAALPGMQLNTGDATNNPGLLHLQRTTGQTTEGSPLASENATINNGVISGAINKLGDTTVPSAANMSDALDQAYAARKTANQAKWKAADVSNAGNVSGFQFNNFMNKYIDSLPVADKQQIPGNIVQLMQDTSDARTRNLGDVQAVRSAIMGAKRQQNGMGGNPNTARILGGLADKADEFIDMRAQALGTQYPLYKAARADTLDMKKTFETPPAVRKAIGIDSYGADKVPVSQTADHFLGGTPEDFNAYLNAISTKDPKTGAVNYDPAGVKAVQDAFANRFINQVTNLGSEDGNGNNIISPVKMKRFLDNNSHIINSPIYTPAQRDLVTSIAKATQQANRSTLTKPYAGGSDTFSKLQGKNFIDVLVGPGASKLVGGGTGIAGGIAGYHAGGPVGAVGGMIGGGKIGDYLGALYNAPRQKVVDTVVEAMHDPDLAKGLMLKASNANAKLMAPSRRAKIWGALSANTAPVAVGAVQDQQ